MKAKKKLISKPKDPHAGREESRRFAANVSTGLLVIGAIVGLVAAANHWLAREPLHGVRIIGRVVLDSAEIMQQAAIPSGVPLKKLDLQTIERRIASHPFISRAAVYRGESGMLVVEIAERNPVAVTFIGESPLYLDSTGFALPYRFSSASSDIPVLSGLSVGESIDSAHAVEALGVVRMLRDYSDPLYRQISEIRREADGEYTFLTTDGSVPVRAGYPGDILPRLAKLDAFLGSVLPAEGADRANYIDLRWKGEVVVRWREEGRMNS
jgi:cell division protein FtsQ